jgi:hypothetical protein
MSGSGSLGELFWVVGEGVLITEEEKVADMCWRPFWNSTRCFILFSRGLLFHRMMLLYLALFSYMT